MEKHDDLFKTTSIEFSVPGDPIALKRHRTFNRGGRSLQFDPSAGDKADFLAKAMQNKPSQPFSGPVVISLYFYFKRPKNHYNSKGLKPGQPSWHSKRPDIDNLIKFVLDALNGVYFKDDAQVFYISSRKSYSDIPNTHVIISKIKD